MGGEQARAKEDEANLKKAIAESVETLEEDKLVRRAISESLSETEEEEPKMKEQSPKKKKNPLPKKITAAAATVTKNQEDPDNVIAAKIVKVVRKNVLKARFVKDSEGRHPAMFPGQTFTHTWRLMNSGTSTWSENVTVSCVGGDAMKGSETPVVIPPVGPNQIFDATIEVSAPAVAGRYITYYRLHDGNVRFGDRIWIDVTVVDPSELTEVEMNQMFPVASSASSPAVVDDDKKEEEEEEEDDDDNSCIVGALPVPNFETDDSDVSDVSDAEDKDEDED